MFALCVFLKNNQNNLSGNWKGTLMPLLRYDETVNVNGREKNIHSTQILPAAVYDYDVVERPVPWHWHEELELFHLLSGSIVCMIGTSQFRLTSGEAYFVNTEVLHGAWSDTSASCRFHSIVFHPRLIGGDTTSVFWQKYLHPLQLNQSLPFMVFQPVEGWQRQVILQMEQAWELICQQEDGYEFRVRNHLSDIFLQIWKHGDVNAVSSIHRNLREEDRIKKMLLFMEEHITDEITNSEIASAAFISNTECMRCFKNVLHTTPGKYLRQLRLSKAKQLLLSTPMKVEKIGELCGFREMSYFAKVFRAEYGSAPLTYRKEHGTLPQ